MKRRKRTRARSQIWMWISFIIFALIIVLLGASVLGKKSPAHILSNLFSKNKGSNELLDLSKVELVARLSTKDSVITALRDQIDEYIEMGGLEKAQVSVNSESLNMRSSPSINSDVVLKIPNESMVDILYFDTDIYTLRGEEGKWCKVAYADTSGWVWGNFLVRM